MMNHAKDALSFLPQTLNSTEDLIYIMAVDGEQFRYAYLNQAASTSSGVTDQDMGKTLFEFYENHSSMAQYLHNKYRKVLLARRSVHFEDGFILPSGALSGESILSPVFGEQEEITHVICVTRNSVSRQEYEDKLRHYAFHDELTQLYNRRFLYEFISNPRIIWLIDLDNFKNINDTLGHEVGDTLLIQVAGRLSNALGPDYLAVRLGGDEFMIVATKQDDQPENMAQEILNTFTDPFNLNGRTMNITASVGVAVGAEQVDVSTLLRNADIALYHAKARGRNQYHIFDERQSYEQLVKFDYELALAGCIEREELELVYQPIYDTVEEKIVAVEALLRWNKDHAGLIPPDKFIPVAEESGWIVPIGEWIIRQACRDWPVISQKYGSDTKIAVNISRVQLSRPNFTSRLMQILKEEDVATSIIDLEITETVVMHSIREVNELLTMLREHGFTVTLDDFGTGYSSLSMLTQLPIDKIKIDRSFIVQMNPPVIASLLVMASALNLSVIAEGVEDQEQLYQLAQMGCPKVQGYLISRPVPPSLLPEI